MARPACPVITSCAPRSSLERVLCEPKAHENKQEAQIHTSLPRATETPLWRYLCWCFLLILLAFAVRHSAHHGCARPLVVWYSHCHLAVDCNSREFYNVLQVDIRVWRAKCSGFWLRCVAAFSCRHALLVHDSIKPPPSRRAMKPRSLSCRR